MNKDSIAFGAPGIEPRWTSAAKDGIGTAYHSASCIWFTLGHGIINEIYFPHVDSPNTRDLQFRRRIILPRGTARPLELTPLDPRPFDALVNDFLRFYD